MPVVVGALAASPRIYSLGMGRPVEEIEAAWTNAIANPIPPVRVTAPPCQEVVIKGDDLRGPGRGLAALPVPISTPGFDAAPYLTATLASRAIRRPACRTWAPIAPALKATDRLGVRMAARIGGAGGYLHWRKYNKREEPMPCAIVIGCAPVVMFTGPHEACRSISTRWRSPAGSPARRSGWRNASRVDLDVPADAEIVIEGLIDPELLEPEGPFGESHGHVALEDFNMSMQVTAITRKRTPVFVSIISQVTPSESSVIKKVAYEPLFLAHLRDQLSIKGVRARGDARAADQSAQGDLRAIRARHAAHRGLARAARRVDAARRLRQDLHRGERGHRSDAIPTRCSGRSPIAPIRSRTCIIAPYRSAGTGRSPVRATTNSRC